MASVSVKLLPEEELIKHVFGVCSTVNSELPLKEQEAFKLKRTEAVNLVLGFLQVHYSGVLKSKLGLKSRPAMTFDEIAKNHKTTREFQRKRFADAIRLLQRPIYAQHLAEFAGLTSQEIEEIKQKAATTGPGETFKEPTKEQADVHVEDLGLSMRTRKGLLRLCMVNVGQVLKRTENELLNVKHFGHTSVNELNQRLAEIGLRLRKD